MLPPSSEMLQRAMSQSKPLAVADGTSQQNWRPLANSSGKWTRADEIEAGIPDRRIALGPYIRGSYLGSEGWSDAYKIMRIPDGEVFAGKFSKARAKLREEAAILRSLNHVSTVPHPIVLCLKGQDLIYGYSRNGSSSSLTTMKTRRARLRPF